MPTTRRRIARAHNKERIHEAALVLECGHDFFGEFRGPEGEEELRSIWEGFAEEIIAQHVAQDSTTRPAAFFWWSSPQKIRLEVFHNYPITEQRMKLLEARVFDGEAAKLARQKIEKWRASGRVMADYDLHEPRPEIQL